jgi:hypothetical protein
MFHTADKSVSITNYARQVFVLFIGKNMLLPHSERILDYETDIGLLNRNQCNLVPEDAVRTLFMIQHILRKPQYGKFWPKETKNYSSYFMNSNGKYVLSVSQYVNVVKDLFDVVIGFNFYFVIDDPFYSLEKAFLEYFFCKSKVSFVKNKKKRKKKAPGLGIEKFKSLHDFLKNGLLAYRGVFDEETVVSVLAHPFDDSNPGCFSKMLNFEYASELILKFYPNVSSPYVNFQILFPYLSVDSTSENASDGGDAHDADVDSVSDYTFEMVSDPTSADDVDNGANTVAPPKVLNFFGKTLKLNYEQQDPNFIFKMNLNHLDVIDTSNAQIDFNRFKRQLIENVVNDNIVDENPFCGIKNLIKNETQHLNVVDRLEFLMSSTMSDAVDSLSSRYTANNGFTSAMEWMKKISNTDQEFVMCKKNFGIVDNTLSEFGNFVAVHLYLGETLLGSYASHAELVYAIISSTLTYDIPDNSLRLHVVYAGPPTVGKSWLLEQIEKFSIPDTIKRMSVETSKACTTDDVINGNIIMYDELGNAFTGKGDDGSGLSTTKEWLARGSTVTLQCNVNEDRTRTNTMHVCERRSDLRAATNLTKFALPPAILSRIYFCEIAGHHRTDTDTVSENHDIKTDLVRVAGIEDFYFRIRCFQFVAAFYFFLVQCSILPEIDLLLSNRIASLIYKYVEVRTKNYLENRDKHRIMLYCKAVTLFAAIEKVFFSGTILAKNTPFNYKQMFLLIPFLVARREHVYFAMSSMSDVIVDPNIVMVLEAINHLVNAGTSTASNDNSKYSTVTVNVNGRPEKQIDYNYYFIPLTQQNNEDVTMTFATKICGVIRQRNDIVFSESTINDILKTFLDRQCDAKVYSENDTLSETTNSINVARVQRSMKLGFEISRFFLDQSLGTNKDLVAEAIESTFDKHMAETRIVLGKTFVTGYPNVSSKVGYSFVYKVVDVTLDHKKQVLEIENAKRVRFASSALQDDDNATPISSEYRYHEVDSNLENYFIDEMLKRTGAVMTPELGGSKKTSKIPGTYPSNIVSGYLKEIQKPDKTTQSNKNVSHLKKKLEDNLSELGLGSIV